MNVVTRLTPNESHSEKLVSFPGSDDPRIPYDVYSSPEIYNLEEDRILSSNASSELPLPRR